MTAIAGHITAFLRDRMARDRAASVHTCDAYAYSFQLLFAFVATRRRTSPSQLELEHLDATTIVDFLNHLQEVRNNGPRTRNARLAAIRSFMRFVEHRVPAALGQIHEILAIPTQRATRKLIRHLEPEESQAILDSPDPASRLGTRDRAMLHLALAAGLRVSELVGIRLDDAKFRGRYVDLIVHGKGRKERALTLWKAVADSLQAYLAVRTDHGSPQLFLNARGEPLTRSGFEAILNRHVRAAVERCPSIRDKRISPHVLRHTCALNLLRATGDVRKVALWLGHENIQTTEMYLRVDPLQRIAMLSSVTPPSLRPGKFRAADRLIQSLRER